MRPLNISWLQSIPVEKLLRELWLSFENFDGKEILAIGVWFSDFLSTINTYSRVDRIATMHSGSTAYPLIGLRAQTQDLLWELLDVHYPKARDQDGELALVESTTIQNYVDMNSLSWESFDYIFSSFEFSRLDAQHQLPLLQKMYRLKSKNWGVIFIHDCEEIIALLKNFTPTWVIIPCNGVGNCLKIS